MPDFWEQQIARADYLAGKPGGSGELLGFYGKLLRAQQEIYRQLCDRDWVPAGDLQSDIPKIRSVMSGLLEVVGLHGPPPLASKLSCC